MVKDPSTGIYRYYRRVPTEVAHFDKRVHVKKSLKTKNHKDALDTAETLQRASGDYWRALLDGTNAVGAIEEYQAAVKDAQRIGFTYRPASQAAQLDLVELERQLSVAEQHFNTSSTIVDVALGTTSESPPPVSDIWKLYLQHNEAGLTGMSPNQMRKHKISRERAIRYSRI